MIRPQSRLGRTRKYREELNTYADELEQSLKDAIEALAVAQQLAEQLKQQNVTQAATIDAYQSKIAQKKQQIRKLGDCSVRYFR